MSFVLSEVEQQALRSVHDLEAVSEYGLRGMNIIRVEADGVTNPSDSQLTFTIDSSKLAGNIMLNRVQMEADVAVTASGTLYGAITPGWTNDLRTGNAGEAGFLISPANGALDALFLNKAFSAIELSNKQVQLVQDSRTPEKIDILARLLCPKHLNEAGIYLDNTYGPLNYKCAGQWQGQTLSDPSTGISVFGRGCSLEDMQKCIFFKRNTNGQYIVKKSNVFQNSSNVVVAGLPIPPEPYNLFQRLGGISGQYNWDWVSGGATLSNATQTVVYRIKEDLLHDIFVSQYQQNPVYMGLPTTDLVFTFTKSNVINSLYKTSNQSITNITVSIRSLKLNVLTYNYGLIDMPIKDYFVPFYSEQINQQTVSLSNNQTDVDNGTNDNRIMQTRQYNSVPQYFIIYAQEPTSSSGTKPNLQNALKPCSIKKLRLQIDNETDGPLYNMNIDELKHRTLTNLADDPETVDALFRNEIQHAYESKTFGDGYNSSKNWASVNNWRWASGVSANRSQLDGLFVLKIGKDIRLPSDMCVGQDRKVSFTFTIDFGRVQNDGASADPATNLVACQFYQIAYFPSVYKFSPDQGLLKAERFVVSDSKFRSLVDNTNSMVRSKSMKNHLIFNSQRPLMVGSGFGNLLEVARMKMPFVRHIVKSVANLAGDIADEFEGDIARKISQGARAVSKFVAPKKKSRKVGRPKRRYE